MKQETQSKWGKIDKSNQCKDYSKWKAREKYRENSMRFKRESLEHVWKCKNAKEFMEKNWIEVIEEKIWKGENGKDNAKLVKVLRGDPTVEMCKYSKRFVGVAKKERKA